MIFATSYPISTPPVVTPAPFSVTPAEAGAQGNRQSLASGKAVKPAMCRMGPWVPASAGMTMEGAGMTMEGAGMTGTGGGAYKS